MGKLGARELNFSSDIDLILFFDSEAPAIKDPHEGTELFSRLARRLMRILQDRTGEGYVFRTDLRLRPDPGSTPLAIPVRAALHYYEGRGQNWERAAMIKARPVAGDIAAAEAFLAELQPYVWRKYMDYAAIADVHSIKRQIHAHKGHGEIAVKGHNVKLGRGGIREIEFFVQTQQLIAGGRFPRPARPRDRADAGGARRAWLDHRRGPRRADRANTGSCAVSSTPSRWSPTSRPMCCRTTMPASSASRICSALPMPTPFPRRSGNRCTPSSGTMRRCSRRPRSCRPASATSSSPATSTIPTRLQTLAGLGFERPSDICRVIRGWHFGRYRATLSAEARERLTELTPALLKAFGETRRADEALVRFDAFLAGLPAGIQLFSLLHSNPSLLKLLATIMGAAPRLAATITRRPHVFDGMLDPAPHVAAAGQALSLRRACDPSSKGSAGYEEILDRLRIFTAEQKFLIGVRLLTDAIDPARAGKAFSDLADLTIGAALDAVLAEFAARHGHVAGSKVAILGMGKLGSRELTAGSDVDLILLYDHKANAEESDGPKPLAPSHYFTRLTQRLIAAVSAPTAEGVLYELDLRLRPSGNKGPVATHIESFCKYQRQEAWTWEHMALTRARIVAGDAELRRPDRRRDRRDPRFAA